MRQTRRRGVGYGLLRYLHPDATVRARLGRSCGDVVFNYLGQLDAVLGDGSLFALASEATGPLRSPHARRSSRLELTAAIVDGQLQVELSYSDRQYQRETIEQIGQRYITTLRAIIAHCKSAEADAYTPSDFPLARLDQVTLDEWLGGRRGIEAVYPLSPMQEGMLFHTLLEPGSPVYFQQMSCILNRVDVDRFEKAWQRAVARHPALRTSFWWQGLPRPLQCVHAAVDMACERHDWSALSSDEQETRREAWLVADRARGFTLDRAPLMRLTTCALGGERTLLVWNFHHLLLDGWSASLVIRDVFAAYQGAANLPPTGAHEAYIRWLSERDPAETETFWRDALRGFGAATPLGLARGPRARGRGARAAHRSVSDGERGAQASGAPSAA